MRPTKKELRRDPQHIDDDKWFYESRDGLDFCVYPKGKNPVTFKVPAWRLRRYLVRLGK